MSSVASRPARRYAIRFHELALIVSIVAVLVLTLWLDQNHSYWNEPLLSLKNIARSAAMLGIVSLGSAMVIIAGGIDLSAGSMIAFGGTVCATLMILLNPETFKSSQPVGTGVIILAILGTLAVGFLVGTLHTWLIAIVRLPPFIATLGTLVGLRSIARILCYHVTESALDAKQAIITVNDPNFRQLGKFVPIPVAIFLVLAVSAWLLLSRTVIGRHLYALGGNEEAARLSGIRTERVKWLAYCIGSMTAAIAGILFVGDVSAVDPNSLAVGFELNAIAAAVVGGCSLLGGVGTISGVVLGVLFLQVVVYGVSIVIRTEPEVYTGLVVGLVLVFASVLSRFRETARPGRQLFAGVLGLFSILTLTLLVGTVVWLVTNQLNALISGGVTLALLTSLKIREGGALRRRTVPPAPLPEKNTT